MALRPAGDRGAVANDASEVATRVARLQPLPPPLLVREAPGGLERPVTRAWAAAGLPGGVVHPRQARTLARATGQLAHTEALDARARAPCAAVFRPTPRPRPDAPTQALRARWGTASHGSAGGPRSSTA
jgi:transposase